MEGSFDGLNGYALTGWLQDGRGGVVTLMFGNSIVARARADRPRADLAAAGIAGSGFTIPLLALEAYLKGVVDGGDDPIEAVKVVTVSGALLGRPSNAFTASDLLKVLSVAVALRTLNAPLEGGFLDIY
jgi:hypothetical protein